MLNMYSSMTDKHADHQETVELTKEPDPAFSSDYLMAMIFPVGSTSLLAKISPEDAQKYAAKKINAMIKSGLDVFPYVSESGDYFICLIGIHDTGVVNQPKSTIHKYADLINFNMLLDEVKIEKVLHDGYDKIEGRVFPPHEKKYSPLLPFQYIYGSYEWERHDELFTKTKPEDVQDDHFSEDPFTPVIRIKLIYELLRARKKNGGCGFNLSEMQHKGDIISLFPLHASKQRHALFYGTTMGYDPKKYDLYREYFGEKISLYFNFLGHLGYWLILPGVIGLGLSLVSWSYEDFSHPVLPFFAVIISFWSFIMLEYWGRTSKDAALRWGMLSFEKTETDRPEFIPDHHIQNFVTGELISSADSKSMVYVSMKKQRRRYMLSLSVISVMVMLVISVVLGIYFLKFYLNNEIGTLASVVASVLNSVQIAVFNVIYNFVAKKMTQFENNRTDSIYENSMIAKLFFFQFVNSYSSFFFLAFIAAELERPAYLSDDPDNIESKYEGECGWVDCMKPLSINVAIIFLVRLIVTNFASVFIPWFAIKSKKDKALKACGHLRFSPAEDEMLLNPYDPIHDSISKFSDVAVQYGYMVMFATSLPAACILSALNFYVTSRANLWLMLRKYQRPIPMGANSIGTWQTVFEILSIIAVPTNAGLICYTMNILDRNGFSKSEKTWLFIGIQWVFLTIQQIIAKAIPDESDTEKTQIARQEFIISKVLLRTPDEDKDIEVDENDDKVHFNTMLKEYPMKNLSVEGTDSNVHLEITN